MKFQNAVNEYSPEQRRAIDARLSKALADVKSGLQIGPFVTVDEAIASMEQELRKRPKSKRTVRSWHIPRTE